MFKQLGRLWRGEFGLTRTFWSWGVFAGVAWQLGFFTLGNALQINEVEAATPYLLGTILVYSVAALVYGIMFSVGLVRAARAYEGGSGWKLLAVLFTVLGWLSAGVVVVVSL